MHLRKPRLARTLHWNDSSSHRKVTGAPAWATTFHTGKARHAQRVVLHSIAHLFTAWVGRAERGSSSLARFSGLATVRSLPRYRLNTDLAVLRRRRSSLRCSPLCEGAHTCLLHASFSFSRRFVKELLY